MRISLPYLTFGTNSKAKHTKPKASSNHTSMKADSALSSIKPYKNKDDHLKPPIIHPVIFDALPLDIAAFFSTETDDNSDQT